MSESFDRTVRDFEHLLMELAIGFVNTPHENLDAAIQRALAMTGSFTQVDRSYLFLYDFDRQTCSNTQEWCAEGIEPMIDLLQDVPLAGIEDWLSVHLRGQIMHVPSVVALPPESALRQLLEPQGVQTLIAVPLMYGGGCIGFVGFDAVRTLKPWSEEEIKLLRVLAELFTNAEIGRRRTLEIERTRNDALTAERRLQRAMDASEFAIWEWDLEADSLLCVSGWDRLLEPGLDGRSFARSAVADRLHPDDRFKLHKLVEDSRSRPDKAFETEIRLQHADAAYRPVQCRWVVDLGRQAQAVRLCGSAVDLTRSKKAQALVERRAKIDAAISRISSRFVGIEAFDDAMAMALAEIGHLCGASRAQLFLCDTKNQVVSNSHEWCAPEVPPQKELNQRIPFARAQDTLRQLKSGEAVAVPNVTALPARLPERAFWLERGAGAVLSLPLMVGGVWEGFLTLKQVGKSANWNSEDSSLLRSVAEIIAGALARNRAEAALRSSEKNYRNVLNSLTEIVIRTDATGRMVFLNEAWTRLTGRSVEQSVGLRLADLIHPGDAVAESLRTEQACAGLEVARYALRVYDSRHELRWMSVLKRTERSGDGHVIGTLATLVDVTDQHLWEESLIQAKIRAENASEAKTLYLSNLSHELRTPMHGVLGMLELLMKSSMDVQQRRFAADAYTSAKTLLGLLDDILDIAKIERGMLKLFVGRVDLWEMTEGAVALFRLEAERKGLQLQLRIAPDVPHLIVTDELRLRQVISNLVGNAVKFTDAGSVTVSVERRFGGLRLQVADTGIGIDPAEIPRLFTPFVQLDSSNSRRFGGSGLGLPIVKEIVRLMEGNVEIVSDLGSGTRVCVDLPLHLPDSDGSFALPVKNLVLPSLPGLRVLIAEDNEINKHVACEHLERLGCTVQAVTDGQQAVDACRRGVFDVILMDCSMPNMDGLEATRQIRTICPRELRIVGCTADASEEKALACHAAGMDGMLIKPYSKDELRAVLVPAEPDGPTNAAAGVAAATVQAPVLDLAGLEQLGEDIGSGDLSVVRELLGLFRQDAPEQVAGIKRAAEAAEADRFANAVHSLKSSAAALCARRLAELCGRIELGVRRPEAGQPVHAGQLRSWAEQLSAELEAALEALEQQLDDRSPAGAALGA